LIYDRIKILLKYTLPFLLSLLLLYLAFKGLNFAEFYEKLKSTSYFYLILLVISTIFSHWIRAYRWKIILQKQKNISTLNAFKSLLIGYAFNCVIPRSGEVTRSFVLGMDEKLSKSVIIGSVILERVFDMIIFIISILISLIILGEKIYTQIPSLKYSLYIILLLLIIFILFVYQLQKYEKLKEKLFSILNFIKNESTREKIKTIINKILIGFASINSWKEFFVILFYSIVLMLIYGFNAYLGFFTINIFYISYSQAYAIMSIGAIGVFIPTPGGVGSFHIMTNIVLNNIIGLSLLVSLTYSFVMHMVGYIIQLILGIVFYINFHYNHKDKKLKDILKI